MRKKHQSPAWLQEFENLANEQLEKGSSCHQVHPIIEAWYLNLLSEGPEKSRDSVMQAMSCLSTELMTDMPEEIFEALFDYDVDDASISTWIQGLIMIGRAFERSLDRGDLDDL